MNNLLLHLVEFSITLSVLYLAFRLLIYRERFHRLNRFILLAIPGIALLVATVKINLPADLSNQFTGIVTVRNLQETILTVPSPDTKKKIESQITDKQTDSAGNENDLKLPYLLIFLAFVSTIMLIRVVRQNLLVLHLIKTCRVYPDGKLRIVEITRELSPFSYFNYVFLNPQNLEKSEIRDILAHEYIHYIQRHSRDNLYLEVVGLFQWFNPFYWLLRTSLKETHEYLADEGVLNQGTDKSNYQALLLNQVAECPVPAITCNFSQSLTKKRIIMMQKSKKSMQRTLMRFFAFLPVILLLALIFSCNIQTREKEKYVASVSPTKMNVLYLGVDNPLAIAVSSVSPEQIVVESDNGDITGNLGNYIMHPKRSGTAKIKVFKVKKGNKVLLKETYFRVKTVPDPIAMIAGCKGGEIARDRLLDAKNVQAVLQNFDFDLTFRVTEFTISTVINGSLKNVSSKSSEISEEQKDLISSLKVGSPVFIQHVKAAGPDGTIRPLNTISLKISE